jgi:hypothetical protein
MIVFVLVAFVDHPQPGAEWCSTSAWASTKIHHPGRKMKMPRFSGFRLCLALALIAIAGNRQSARADFITSLGVSTMAVSGGLTEYDYTLADLSTSTVTASFFYLDVDSTANLTALTAPTGWDISYTPGDTAIGFTSPAPSFDIQPGTVGLFSFDSPLTPVIAPYAIAGIDSNSNYIENDGVVFTPSIVPEPSSALLCAMGAVGALGFHRRWKRNQSASAPR